MRRLLLSLPFVFGELAMPAWAGPGDHHGEKPGAADEHHAHEHPKFEELPMPVQQKIREVAGEAEIEHLFKTKSQQGADVFVVEFKKDSAEHALALRADGSLLRHEIGQTLEQLPAAVRDQVKAISQGAELTALKKVIRPRGTQFIAEWLAADKKNHLVLNEDGSIREHKTE